VIRVYDAVGNVVAWFTIRWPFVVFVLEEGLSLRQQKRLMRGLRKVRVKLDGDFTLR